MASIKNTFKKLDTDTSQNKRDNSSFYDAENLRLISDEALTNGALVNYKGTKAKIDLGNNYTKLKGYAEVGDSVALLLHRDISGDIEYASNEITATPITNFTNTTPVNKNNRTNYTSLGSVEKTVIGVDSGDIDFGIPIRYINSNGIQAPINLQSIFETYKLSLLLSVNNECTIIIGNSNCLTDLSCDGIGKDVLDEADINEIIPYNSSTGDVEINVPEGNDGLYVIIYKSTFTYDEENLQYILNSTDNTTILSIETFQYFYSEYINININHTADFTSLVNTYFDTTTLVTKEVSTIIGDGYGYKYRLHFNILNSASHNNNRIVITNNDNYYSNIAYNNLYYGVFDLDLTTITSINDIEIWLYANVDETVYYEFTEINKLNYNSYNYDLYEIDTDDQQVLKFNLVKNTNSSSVSEVNILIYDNSAKEVIKSYTEQLYIDDSVNVFIPISNLNGYYIGIELDPINGYENDIDVKNFTVYTINSNETLFYEFNNNTHNILSFNSDNTDEFPEINNIELILKNTTLSTVINTYTINIGSNFNKIIVIPDDGYDYKLYANPYKDSITLVSIDISDGLLIEYDLDDLSDTGSLIAKCDITEDDYLNNITILYSDSQSVEKLGFDTVDYIECIGRYENSLSKKIYFTLPDKPIRLYNIADETYSTIDANLLDILPNSNPVKITINSVLNGGMLESSKIQYTCRLFNKYNSETSFSPLSELVSITKSVNNGKTEFTGSDIEINANKAVKIDIDINNDNFDYIRIYSVVYKSEVPTVNLISEQRIISDVFSFVDTGVIIDTISLEEFVSFGGRLVTAETLSVKNNILFAGNVKEIAETLSDDDIDCRAYRFDYSGICKIYEADDSYYKIYKAGLTMTGTSGTSNDGDWEYYDSSDIYQDEYDGYDAEGYGTDYNIPLTADCINKYNNEFLVDNESSTNLYDYQYQLDGSTLGGIGKVISYEIKVEDNFTKLVDNGDVDINSDNINYVLKSKSFKQGETYRIGITFFDTKGKPYFNKWIGDIRIPYLSGEDNIMKSLYSSKLDGSFSEYDHSIDISMRNIYIEFSINTSNIPNGILEKISGYNITYVDRININKSVIAQGYTIGGITYDLGTSKYIQRSVPIDRSSVFDTSITNGGYDDYYDYMTTIYSPEFNVNDGIEPNDNCRLKIVKILANPKSIGITTTGRDYINSTWLNYEPYSYASSLFYPITETYSIDTGLTEYTNDNELQSLTGEDICPGYSFLINRMKKNGLSEYNSSAVDILPNNNSVRFSNRVSSGVKNSDLDGSDCFTMYGSTSIVVSSETRIPYNNSITQYGYIYLIDIYIDNADSRYGGNTYLARTLNNYISISEFKLINETCIGYGDTYNTIFDTLTSIVDPNLDDGSSGDYIFHTSVERRQIVGIFPLESSINCILTNQKPSKYITSFPSGRNIESIYIGLTEKTSHGISLYGSKYPSLDDFNKYNTVYSVDSKYPIYTSTPVLFDDIKEQPYNIIASEVKTNGEFVDSWSKFLYNNFIEVESLYGAIHKLTTLDNKLYFFQENAIGVVAVNDRYIINNGSAEQLALGTGGVLERFDYIRYNSGAIKPQHVINTTNGLYYIDNNKKAIDILRDSQVSLSIEKGVNSLFRSLYKNSDTKITLGYDPKYREVLFTIGNRNNGKTLVFNEYINEFGPRSSSVPDLYVNISNWLYSYLMSNQSIIDTNNYIYKHNAGYFGESYSEAKYQVADLNFNNSTISIIVGTNGQLAVFDNIEFNTEVRDYDRLDDYNTNSIFNDIEYNLKTVNEIDFKNSYQSVNKIIKVKNVDTNPNTARLMRSWTTSVPLTSEGKRFVDTFISLTFKFINNTNNRLFKIHDITTHIRPTHK